MRDLPVAKTVAGRQEPALDVLAILRLFQSYAETAKPLLAVMEQSEFVRSEFVRSDQAAYEFGYAHGVLSAACLNAEIPLQTIRSVDWKRHMYLPGRQVPLRIYCNRLQLRVTEHFEDSHLFYTAKGLSITRAEAALLACFGIQCYFPES